MHDVKYNVEDILDEILEADPVLILSDQGAFLQQIRSSIFRNDLKIIKDWNTNLNSFAQDLKIKDKN